MERHNGFFTPDEVDEQIEQLTHSLHSHTSQQSPSTDMKFIYHLKRFFEEENSEADERSLERVGVLLQLRRGLIVDHAEEEGHFRIIAGAMPGNKESQAGGLSSLSRKTSTWQRHISMIAAVMLLTLLIGSIVIVLTLAQSSRNGSRNEADTFTDTLQNGFLYRLDLTRRAVAWSTKINTDGYIPDTSAVSNDVVYISASLGIGKGADFAERPYVYAYNNKDGSLLWRTQLDSRVVKIQLTLATSGSYTDSFDLGFTSQPVVANGLVYVIARTGRIYALDAATGLKRWVYDTHITNLGCSETPAQISYDCGFNSEPNLALGKDAIIYATVKNDVFAFNGMSGSKLWNIAIGQSESIEHVGASGGTVYITSLENGSGFSSRYSKLYALDAGTGKQRWVVIESSLGFGMPVIADGVVYIGSFDGTIYAFSNSDGSLLWHRSLGAQIGVNISETNGVVYVQTEITSGSGTNRSSTIVVTLFALNAADGSVRWQHTLDTHNTLPRFQVVSDGVVYLVILISPAPVVSQGNVIRIAQGHLLIVAYSALDGHQ